MNSGDSHFSTDCFVDQTRRSRDAIDRRLATLTPDALTTPLALVRAWEHAALAPGKRLRGLLLLAVLQDLGSDPAIGLDAACAIELIHTASLVIDDLPSMDDAKLRRGRATLHTVVGESVAILTAIALVSQGFALCAEMPGNAVCGALARAVGHAGLVSGQVRDLEPECTTTGAVEATYRAKTGTLFVVACEIATLLLKVDNNIRRNLLEFADHIGLAFQALDDGLDTLAEVSEVGKDVRQDRQRATFAAATSAAEAAHWGDGHFYKAKSALSAALPSGAVAAWLAAAFPADMSLRRQG